MNSVQPTTGLAGEQAPAAGQATERAVRIVGVSRTYRVAGGVARRSAAGGGVAAASGAGTLRALDNVSLEIPSGQRVALLGPNGSGKSTLLRIIATLDRPDPGGTSAVELLGEPPAARTLGSVRRRLGVVFQSPGLDRLLTIQENLAAAGALYGLGGSALQSRILWAAGRLGLQDRMHDRVGTLSGGLARRADLARALLHDPDLLLLDEPTSGLDPRARDDFLSTLESVAGEPRTASRPPLTIIMSTHLMDEAQRMGRIILLHRGRIIADATPEALRRQVGADGGGSGGSGGGGGVLRCHTAGNAETLEAARGILSHAGLTAETPRNEPRNGRAPDVLLARIPAGAGGQSNLETALVGLLRAGIPFEVGPPTLGDVFLALTGEALDAAELAEPSVPQPHRGRRRRS